MKRASLEGPVVGAQSAPRCDRGFTTLELIVVAAVIGIIFTITIPQFISYYGSASATAGVQEMRTALYRAKQLAITLRQNICVTIAGGNYQFRLGDCAGPVWTGDGTDASGNFALQNGATVSNGGASPIFTPLATALQGGTLTVTGHSGATRAVTVTTSGRITVP